MSTRVFFLLLVFINLFPVGLTAQYAFEYIPGSKPDNFGITAIDFDSDGNIWMGTTKNGVMVYNGSSFNKFHTGNSGLVGDVVYDIYVSESDLIWICTSEGISLLYKNEWVSYTVENSAIPSNQVISIEEDFLGRYWIGTVSGLVYGLYGANYNPGNSGLPGEQIHEIVATPDSTIYFGTDMGFGVYKNGTWESFPTGIGAVPLATVTTFTIDTFGYIWAALGQGVNGDLYTLKDGIWNKVVPEGINYSDARISGIVSLDNGDLWMGTHHEGLLLFKDNVWQQFTAENSNLSINQIMSLAVDSAGVVWLGSREGLHKVVSVVNADKLNEAGEACKIYPNPAGDLFRIVIDSGKRASIELFNRNGMMVYMKSNVYSGDIIYRPKSLSPGQYIYKVSIDGNTITGSLIFK